MNRRSASNVASLRHGVGLMALVLTLVFGFAPIAEAHTDFESSDPADGSVITGPVSEIRVRFTAESLVAGDGFVVLTPTGDIVAPEVIVSADQREFTLVFDPPLVDGVVGVQWSVRAGDAHPIEGTFSFTTTAEAIPSEPEPTAALVDDGLETAVESEFESESQPQPAVESAAQEQTIVEPEAEPQAPVESAPLDSAIGSTESASVVGLDDGLSGTVTLDEFLNVDDDGSGLGGPVGFVGRLASHAGSLIAIGVVAFAWLVSRRSSEEMRLFVNLVRQAGVLTIIGTLLEVTGLVMSLGSVADALFGWAGFAVLLRFVGAAGLLATTAAFVSVVEAFGADAVRPRSLVGASGAFSASVGAPENHLTVDEPVAPHTKPSPVIGRAAWFFVILIALSYAFDGHTVTKGNHLLTGIIDLVHVGGGAVWLGGLVCLLVLSRSSHAKVNTTLFIDAVVRFSVTAAVALGAVGVAGLVLTVTILDSVSELWSTAWGRLLIAKVLTVAIAVAAGAFNHFVLVPELQSISAHGDARASFVRTIKIEVAALGLALLATAALVAAAS